MNDLASIILAAGKSKRMKTKTPKILHSIMGKPLIDYALDAVGSSGITESILVIGHEKDKVIEYLQGRVKFVEQNRQLGTGHAVMQAMPLLQDFKGNIIILCGDMPLFSPITLRKFIEVHGKNHSRVSLLTAIMPDPGKLGRIVRDETGAVTSIVEAVDATPEQLSIKEVNTGTYIFNSDFLRQILPKIGKPNVQDELYLTDTIIISNEMGVRVEAMKCSDYRESLGVNDRADMAVAAAVIRERINNNLMTSGVTLYDPDNTYIEALVEIGMDTTILPGCMITGKTRIGSDCVIGPNSRVERSIIGDGVKIQESVIIESTIGDGTTIGPYAHMRPGSVTGKNVKIGNFVETKKSTIDDDSKVPHLSYVGDATVGVKVNIGAGTITCNYDGVRKNPTVIKDGAFIGSNSSLVAPITIGEGAATGAGAVVTKNIPDYKLAVGIPARVIKTIRKQE